MPSIVSDSIRLLAKGLTAIGLGWLTDGQDPDEQAFRVVKTALNKGANVRNSAASTARRTFHRVPRKRRQKVVLMINVVETKTSSVGAGRIVLVAHTPIGAGVGGWRYQERR
ncbi:hypothetical protein ATEIFO6365_0003023100 [Aspergillus terreus]|uniref:Uncharacterized protein n=1 Tax=Aspergillus terreus TaxID=33178 RepID=A0A5M3YSL0_ASPTE|nr:hypothetical protein ATETN484_0003017000 [Aspergillus terreus]GFF14178.1 hypothetical protein ATEIFO6365_0003023100 [Aspergillus terreus]